MFCLQKPKDRVLQAVEPISTESLLIVWDVWMPSGLAWSPGWQRDAIWSQLRTTQRRFLHLVKFTLIKCSKVLSSSVISLYNRLVFAGGQCGSESSFSPSTSASLPPCFVFIHHRPRRVHSIRRYRDVSPWFAATPHLAGPSVNKLWSQYSGMLCRVLWQNGTIVSKEGVVYIFRIEKPLLPWTWSQQATQKQKEAVATND
jgi:hypothetical protein